MRRFARALPGIGVVAAAACFTGTDAEGLPCEQDLDCGLRLKCEEGFCGGRQGEGSTGTTSTGAESDSSSDGGLGVCGNGVVEAPDELCEPPMAGLNSAECDRDCSAPQCGDGIENVLAETCDASQADGPVDSETCDVDCSEVACNDGYHNAVAEPCDDGNVEDFDGCTTQCFVPFFADPMTSRTAMWTVEAPMHTAASDAGPVDYQLPPETSPGSGVATGWRHMGNRWWSGPSAYIGLPTAHQGAPGSTRLVSVPFLLATDLDGDGSDEDDQAVLEQVRFELRFHSASSFDGCADAPERGDGGVIRIIDVDTAEITTLAPVGGHPQTTEGGSTCLTVYEPPRGPNPLVLGNGATPYEGQPAFTGETLVDEQVVVDLDDFRGRTIQIVFEMGFDCLRCDPPDDTGWSIDHVIVAPFAP